MSADSLPPSFEAFVAGDGSCTGCGERVSERWLVDGECPGCRYGGGA
ncbi:hypothetical protein Hbl1158_02760 [Halobaculum sp. CBA1158]|nr:hypothetical protein [Halobaculum sp. CBA1158]UIP00309.1 hypothetical protein Hbl1158_02760 [Halobaculum sp. CBA1158]